MKSMRVDTTTTSKSHEGNPYPAVLVAEVQLYDP